MGSHHPCQTNQIMGGEEEYALARPVVSGPDGWTGDDDGLHTKCMRSTSYHSPYCSTRSLLLVLFSYSSIAALSGLLVLFPVPSSYRD